MPCRDADVLVLPLDRSRVDDIPAERVRPPAGKLPWPPIDADKAIPWIEQRVGLTLAQSQTVAVRVALASKVLVITGGPGVSKTTIVNAISAHSDGKGREASTLRPHW